MESSKESESFVLRDLLQSFQESLDPMDVKEIAVSERDEHLENSMGVNDEILQELHGVCDISNLQCEGEPVAASNTLVQQEYFKTCPTTDVNLDTLARRQSPIGHKSHRKMMSFRYRWINEPQMHSLKAEATHAVRNIEGEDLILNVTVYRPFDLTMQNGFKNLYEDCEYQVLGQQYLTDLRDKISCPGDKVAVGEFSENPHKPPQLLSGDIYKSGFFFINNVFYDDLRDPSAIRYSDPVAVWSKKPGRGLPHYGQEDMESTQFIDLTITLGQPYLYQHQGNCQHVITFSDVKLLHPKDCRDISEYPMCVSQLLIRKKTTCCVCWNTASWISVGFSLSPDHEAYYCNTCFHAFHYDKDGKKISDFTAYPVYQKNAS